MQDSERAQEAKCGLCGEPMPEGEEMFKFHGYSGGCPKPPLAEVAKYLGSMLAAAPPPSGASPQAETSANVRALTVHICEDCLNLRGEMCNEPGCRFCRRTMAEVAEYLDALLIRPRIDGVSVLVDEGAPLSAPNSPPEMSDLHLRSFDIVQAWLSGCQKPGCHPCFECSAKLHAIVKGLLAAHPAPVSPVEPEPPTLEPCAHELDYHNCAECVGPKVEPEPPICSDPHLLKRGCECASCLDPVRLKRQLLEVWEKYRAFVDAVASALHVESERGPVSEVSVIEAARDTLNQLLDSPTVEPEPCVWREKYNELLFAVERAYPGESRHETALRYIREKETVESCAPKAPLKVEREP